MCIRFCIKLWKNLRNKTPDKSVARFYKFLGFFVLTVEFYLWGTAAWVLLIEYIPVLTAENELNDVFLTSLIVLIFIGGFRSLYLAMTTSSAY